MDSLIVFVLDRSSSMDNARTIAAFNAFLEPQQQREDDLTLHLLCFDDDLETIYNFQPIGKVPPLDETTYASRNSTALFAGVLQGIHIANYHINHMPAAERPVSVTMVIQTDGGNNRGLAPCTALQWSEFAGDPDAAKKVAIFDDNKSMIVTTVDAIKAAKKRGWTFVYLAETDGSNTAHSTASQLELDPKSCLYYDASQDFEAFKHMSEAIIDSTISGKVAL